MSHAASVRTVYRHLNVLAPKLIAFLATGLTSSGVILVLQAFGLTIAPELAAILVGCLSSIASFIQRDNLLALAPGQLSLKVLAFVLTSASAVTVVALAGQFGVDLSPWSAAIGIVLTVISSIVGYVKSDLTLAA